MKELSIKEIEDEKIIKHLITLFKHEYGENSNARFAGIKVKDIIAWLEKQGEATDINPSEFDLRLNKLLKQFETLPKEELTSSLSFYLNVVQNNGTYKEEKKDEQKSTDTQKSVEWEPQTGDTFRKKGTTSPTYHLCEKQEDSIIFSFVENREVGISGGEITLFALKRDYELVERPKSIEDVVEEELNKALQTKAEQKHTEWSDTDYVMQRAALEILMASPKTVAFTILKESVIVWLQSLKDRLQPKPKQEWSEEDEKYSSYICAALDCYYRLREERNNTNGQENLDKARNWLYNKLKFLKPQQK